MKVSCQSCSAKYTIADEKVSGRIVKIRCKKCGATIVVNGNDMKADAAADAAAESEVWTLSVDDTDQRTMTVADVQAAYKSGVINDETFCWKEGMDDWLPLREIEALASAVGKSVSLMPSSMEADGGDLFGGLGGGGGGSSELSLGGGGSLFGDAPLAAAAPAAARRSGGRAPAGDLFGGAASAGGEEEVMTSAPGMTAPPGGDAKLTGQRNENSVLFSLNALTSSDSSSGGGGGGFGGGGGRGATTAEGDGSGLIDIRALSSSMNSKDTESSKVDDIMNLSGGGAFNAALTAPVLAPPMMLGGGGGISNSYAPEENRQQSSSKGLMFGLIGLGAFILIAALVVVFAFKDDGKEQPTSKNDLPSTTPSADTRPLTADPGTSGAAGTAAGTTPTPASSAVAPNVGGATTTAGNKPSGGGGGKAAAGGSEPAKPVEPTKPAEPGKPKTLAEEMAAAAGGAKKPESGGSAAGGTAPFDKGAALAALGGVNVASCKKDAGGSGHVKIIFAPSGSVSSATVDDGPFVGTPVGGCVAGKYRGARVPPFAGSPVTVGKSFSIN